MAEYEKVILTNMCMVSDANGRYLVENRLDPSWPGLAFPGGHLERGESVTDSVVRQIYEETGLRIEGPVPCGVKQFFLKDDIRYIIFLYKATRYTGELHSSPEGPVAWMSKEEILQGKMTPRFEDLLKIFWDDSINELYYPDTEDPSPVFY